MSCYKTISYTIVNDKTSSVDDYFQHNQTDFKERKVTALLDFNFQLLCCYIFYIIYVIGQLRLGRKYKDSCLRCVYEIQTNLIITYTFLNSKFGGNVISDDWVSYK